MAAMRATLRRAAPATSARAPAPRARRCKARACAPAKEDAAAAPSGRALSAKELLGEDDAPKQKPDESFMVVGADGFECKSCSYEYTASAGDPSQGAAAGTAFMELPEEWCCPTCGAAKAQFFSKGQVIAGFTQNQQYGLGGNSMSGGQKNLLIWGSFTVFFGLFMSGYLFH